MFSNVGKKCFKLWCVLCAVQFVTEFFVGDKNISVIKMHCAKIKINEKSLISFGNVYWKGLDQNNFQLLVYVLSVVV